MIGTPPKGTAILDVAPDVLPALMACLPAAFAVIGSEESPSRGVVRLVLESAEIAPGYRAHLTCEIADAGLTRTARLREVPAPADSAFAAFDQRAASERRRASVFDQPGPFDTGRGAFA